MSKKIVIPNTTAKKIIDLLKVLSISSKTSKQLKTALNLKEIPHNAINAAKVLGFIEKSDGRLKLSEKFEDLVKYADDHPKIKNIFEKKLLLYKPFKLLIKIIEAKGGKIKKEEIGDLLKAELDADWKESSTKQYVEKLINWGIFGEVIIVDKDSVKLHPKFLSNSLSTENVGMDYKVIFNTYLYDRFNEKPLNESIENIQKLEKELKNVENKRKGALFEQIVSHYFKLFGFSVRTVDGYKEKKVGLSYSSRDGGGDIGLYIHLPVQIQTDIYEGIAIACEAKATSSGAPKKSVDQVRTFSEQIKKMFKKYMIFKIVVSESIGYEPVYAREKAQPDIVHFPLATLKELVKIQKNRFEKNKDLLTALDIIEFLQMAIKEGKIEITIDYLLKFIK